MIIRCAWCKKIIGDKPPYGGKYDEGFTDGICDDCLNRYFPHHADKIKQELEVENIENIYKEGGEKCELSGLPVKPKPSSLS